MSSNRELKEALRELNQGKTQKALLQEEIKWTFNPPHGAHDGGVWERLIQQVKRALYSVLKQQTLDDETLQTAMCEAEAILNDRPITPSSDDPNDIEAPTPNHILQLKGKPIMPPGLFRKEDSYTRKRWRQVQYITDMFWKRWVKEYLTRSAKSGTNHEGISQLGTSFLWWRMHHPGTPGSWDASQRQWPTLKDMFAVFVSRQEHLFWSGPSPGCVSCCRQSKVPMFWSLPRLYTYPDTALHPHAHTCTHKTLRRCIVAA